MLERSPANDIERSFARLFSTDDGRKVLSHLQAVTFQRTLGPDCADQQLRYLEGQRSLVATILRLIDRGRKP
ncbi:MAG: Bbp19 family protein [Alphaproteobacteria bacterium]